jgi:beta-N-acetylhexosaminidase
MSHTSIESVLAQFFIVGFSGTEAAQELLPLMDDHDFTSFIIFERNVRDGRSLASMIQEAGDRAEKLGLPEPLFSADEEGGLISPLGRAVGRLPSAMGLAAGGSEDRARRAVRSVALGLKDIGLDLVLAPVLDVNDEPDNPVIGTRSFGDDPERVASMGRAVIDGYRSAGVACCVKHFPGHGSTTEDSHKCLPVVVRSLDEIGSTHIPPFVEAFEAGVEAVMTAHVAYPLVDGEDARPATLSPEILTDLLREKLGFEGAVISDSMEMMGLSGHTPAPEACIEALKAGVDLFICVAPALAVECVRQLRKAYDRGDLRDKTIERALRKVEGLRERLLCGPSSGSESTSSPEARRTATSGETTPAGERQTAESAGGEADSDRESILGDCYGASVTLLGSESRELKERARAAKRGAFLLPAGLPNYNETDAAFVERMLSRFGIADRWRVVSYPNDPGDADISGAIGNVDPSAHVFFCGLSRGPTPRGQRLLFRALLQSRRVAAAAALLDPYEVVSGFPTDLTRIATYGYWPECLEALLHVLFGGRYATGSLPVR